jgi:outer membrane cobalamin receptor
MHLMDYCSAQNTTDFSTLFLLDARYRYQIHSDLAFSLSGNNLLNKPIEWVKGYPTPGIRVTAGIDLRF